MEHYIVSARKYRPSTFDSVVGQQALTATLKNAIATDRLAHAYLFCGSRGVGKTSCARIFAKTINCTNRTASGEACNECDSCRQFNENRSMNIIELDAASHNGIDDIKSLIEQVMVPPTIGRYRVFIIDEVHMLTTAAFNAFLKTLEEPPAHAIFILATTEKHKIIPTILSRCQIYDFNRITAADMVAHLQRVASNEGIDADPAALGIIARKADGAMRDALSIFDQVAASSEGKITYEATIENLNILDHAYYSRLVETFIEQNVAEALLIYKEIREKGFDAQFFINGLGLYMRDLMVAQNPATKCLLETTPEVAEQMSILASKLHPTFLYRAMDLCNDADFNFRQATNKQFLIELTLIKLCQLLSPSPDDCGSDEGQLKPLIPIESDATELQATSAPVSAPAQSNGSPNSIRISPQIVSSSHTTAVPGKYKIGGSFSLNSTSAPAQNHSEDTSEAVVDAPKPSTEEPPSHTPEPSVITLEVMQQVWLSVAKTLSSRPMTRQTMEECLPIPSTNNEGEWDIILSAQIQRQLLEAELGNIRSAISKELNISDITLNLIVDEGELAPQHWQLDRIQSYMLENYHNLDALMKRYKLRVK